MSYGLNLSTDNRILSATYAEFAAPGMPIVDTLPDGDISDYLYANGEYIFDPIPVPDTTPRAEGNYETETVFEIDGTLYRATQNISTGERILPGVNCETISLVDALNALNQGG